MITGINLPDMTNINVGGTLYSLPLNTLSQPHLSGLLKRINELRPSYPAGIPKSEKANYSVSYFDVDPKYFEKWVVPYIRHSLLPKLEDIPTFRDKRHLIGIAQTVGLTALAEYGEELLKTRFEILVSLKGNLAAKYRMMYQDKTNTINLTFSTKISEIFKLLQTGFYLAGAYDSDSESDDHTVWEICEESYAKEKLEKFNLVFNNMYLNREKTIEFYEILPGSVLHLT